MLCRKASSVRPLSFKLSGSLSHFLRGRQVGIMQTTGSRHGRRTASLPASGPGSALMNEWWRGAVIYQIYPRSFIDSNDDGVGDLPGIIGKLDYVAELGVDGIWLSPFFPSPMKDFGYDVADYCDVDPLFGTLADFDRLVARAHELGLKVIIDQVYSHTAAPLM
jgi:1,4-alpha-glucan branching enzyme